MKQRPISTLIFGILNIGLGAVEISLAVAGRGHIPPQARQPFQRGRAQSDPTFIAFRSSIPGRRGLRSGRCWLLASGCCSCGAGRASARSLCRGGDRFCAGGQRGRLAHYEADCGPGGGAGAGRAAGDDRRVRHAFFRVGILLGLAYRAAAFFHDTNQRDRGLRTATAGGSGLTPRDAGMDTPPQDAQSAFPPPTGLALASLLLGIAAIGLSFILLGFLVGAVGLRSGIALSDEETRSHHDGAVGALAFLCWASSPASVSRPFIFTITGPDE